MSERYRAKVRKLGLGEDPMKKEEAGVAKTQQDHPVYAAMIESVDEGIGHMIQTLKETGQYDNTIIVLISDHGGLSNRGNNNRELATTNLPLKRVRDTFMKVVCVFLCLFIFPDRRKKSNRMCRLSVTICYLHWQIYAMLLLIRKPSWTESA